MEFVNRRRELLFLDQRLARQQAEIAILYGRRRVGKSALLYHWSPNKPRFFFWARREVEALTLLRFERKLRATQGNPEQAPPTFILRIGQRHFKRWVSERNKRKSFVTTQQTLPGANWVGDGGDATRSARR
jgi:hypothetical protein